MTAGAGSGQPPAPVGLSQPKAAEIPIVLGLPVASPPAQDGQAPRGTGTDPSSARTRLKEVHVGLRAAMSAGVVTFL